MRLLALPLFLLTLLLWAELWAKEANLYRIEGDTVHFFLSAEDGLKVGQTLYVVRGKTVIAEVKVTSVGAFSSQAAVAWKGEGITFTPSDVVKDRLQGEKRAAGAGASPTSPTPETAGQPATTVALPSSQAEGKIVLVIKETALVNRGSFHGVGKGDKLKITRGGKEVGELEIVEVGTYHAVGSVAAKEALKRGDTAAKGG